MSENPDAPAAEAIAKATPEPIREHWVDVNGVRYPPKQAYQLVSGSPRSAFTSHRAIRELRKLGFSTSTYRPSSAPNSAIEGEIMATDDPGGIASSVTTLLQFLDDRDLTAHMAAAEAALVGATSETSASVISDHAFSEDLLDAALAVRARLGRINDVIHATVIARTLPLILAPGEQVKVRPSLAAGNDPTRPFDLETDQRIAEFKVSQWKGADTMRKRGVFADIVHLALDDSDRKAEMYVVGSRPIKFLRGSNATAEWALGRSSPHIRSRFAERFGPADAVTIKGFTSGAGAHISLIDLTTLFPVLGLPEELL